MAVLSISEDNAWVSLHRARTRFRKAYARRFGRELGAALARLRREHDAAGALSLLDEYQARFPKGVLSLEAAVARVDALLMAGRRSDALERLAIPDFSGVLNAAPSGALPAGTLHGAGEGARSGALSARLACLAVSAGVPAHPARP